MNVRGPAVPRSAALVVVFAMGCDVSSVPRSLGVQVDTIDGVEVVTTDGAGVWARDGGAWELDLGAGVVIGELDGPDEAVFGQVAGVVVGPQGEIFVADGQANEIRVFGADGAFLRRMGREGEGPGEFRNISGLAPAPEGIAAQDGTLGRVTVFDPGGEFVRSFRLQRPYMILTSFAEMAFDGEGRFFDRVSLASLPGLDTVGVVAYDPGGAVLDTAVIAGWERDVLTLEREGRPFMSVPRPFAPQPSFTFGPDADVYFTRGADYEVTRYAPDGTPIRVVRRPTERVPVAAEEREAALSFVTDAFASRGGSLPADVRTPEHKGAIARLVVDDLDHLWVLTPSPYGAEAFRWSVHDPLGRFLGEVVTPEMTITQIGEAFVAGTVRDSLGVQRVVIYPLRR